MEDPGVDGRIIFRWFFRNGLDLSGSVYGQVAGNFNRGNQVP